MCQTASGIYSAFFRLSRVSYPLHGLSGLDERRVIRDRIGILRRVRLSRRVLVPQPCQVVSPTMRQVGYASAHGHVHSQVKEWHIPPLRRQSSGDGRPGQELAAEGQMPLTQFFHAHILRLETYRLMIIVGPVGMQYAIVSLEAVKQLRPRVRSQHVSGDGWH